MIHRIRGDEWRRFRDLRLRALRDSPDAFASTYEEEVDGDASAWRAWITGWPGVAEQIALAVVEGHRWVGIAVGSRGAEEADRAHLFAMWVEPGWRGHGYGRALVEEVAGWASSVGRRRLELRVTESNDAAVALYRRCGFREIGTREPLREGTDLWTIGMVRELPAKDGLPGKVP